MKQQYPFIAAVFGDRDRFLINPVLITTGEFRSNSPLIKIIDKDGENTSLLLGKALTEAFEYIKRSPIMDIWETVNRIGEFHYQKQENKYRTLNEFERKNVCCNVVLNEDGTYEIFSPQVTIDDDVYYRIKQESERVKNADAAELGSAVVNITAMLEDNFKKDRLSRPPVNIELLCGRRIKIYPPAGQSVYRLR